MAPNKEKKRELENKKAAPSKKARTHTAEAVVTEDPIMKAIEASIQVSDLPQTVRSMLVTGIRGCLNTPSEEMHEVQAVVVSMVDKVIAAQEARLQESLEMAKAADSVVGVTKAELAQTLSATEAVLAEKTTVVQNKTLVLTEGAAKMSEATALLSDKLALQCTGDAVMLELQEHKDAVQKGIDSDMKAIMEGPADSRDMVATLEIEKLGFDASLIKALPATAARSLVDRGSFDGMVLGQLATSLTRKLTELVKAVEAEAPGAKERSDAVDVARQLLASATTFHENAGQELATAETTLNEASAAVEAATAALTAHEPVELEAASTREQKTCELQGFQNNTREQFVEFVRDRKASSASEVTNAEAKVASLGAEVDAPVTVGGA